MKKWRRRVGPIGLSLAAAALTAVAFAAVSMAAKDDSGSKNSQGGSQERVGPPGPPPMRDDLSAEDRQALESFRSCMEDHGAPAPPAPPAPGEDGDVFERHVKPPSKSERDKIDAAFEACKDELPEGAQAFGPGPGGPPCGPPPGAPRDGKGAGVVIPMAPGSGSSGDDSSQSS